MKALKFTLRPLSAFGTPLAGDTLFGHLCWTLALRRGQAGLTELLEGYTQGLPYAALSDAFPEAMLPKPTLPDAVAGLPDVEAKKRKALRRCTWLPSAEATRPLRDWLNMAVEAPSGQAVVVTQNTINRLTGTTGRDAFAPRQVEQIVFARGALLDLYAVHDETRLSADELQRALEDIGATGFGRDASAGLGKFEVASVAASTSWPSGTYRHAMTLAPCAFDPRALDASQCFWLPVTRFGRHGGVAALSGEGGPFKRPLMMARTGAVITCREPTSALIHGSGLGGTKQPISGVIPATVHQGYAPVVPIKLESGS